MRPKKYFGQNFLTQPKIAMDLVHAGDITGNEIVLEIGPGKCILTEKLLETGARVVAVEKDAELINFLKTKFEKEIKSGQLEIINDDIRDFNIQQLATSNYKLVANIPYYITGEILRKFLENDCQPERMVLMIQKEVAERIIAKNGRESILSLSVKAYGKPKIEKKVKAGSFFPKPKVDSTILAITNISRKNFKLGHSMSKWDETKEKDFFALVKKGFKSRRKQLRANLGIEKEEWHDVTKKLGLEELVRAENLSLDNWFALAKHLN